MAACEECGYDRYAPLWRRMHQGPYRPVDLEWICSECRRGKEIVIRQAPARWPMLGAVLGCAVLVNLIWALAVVIH